MNRVILWDFDGTLAYRPGTWSGCLIHALDTVEPEHARRPEDFSPWLQSGFPWHAPERPHPELSDGDAWWGVVEGVLAQAYREAGYSRERAAYLAHLAHLHYVDPLDWRLFDDSLPVLTYLHGTGWRHVILSNHVPELPAIVQGLGLAGVVDRVITSAATGYEKPHPAAFAPALDVAGRSGEIWMIGDNPDADIRGAEAAGIPGILVRATTAHRGLRHAFDLWGAVSLIQR
jgi:putative hydrolase of the HAD superfamily